MCVKQYRKACGTFFFVDLLEIDGFWGILTPQCSWLRLTVQLTAVDCAVDRAHVVNCVVDCVVNCSWLRGWHCGWLAVWLRLTRWEVPWTKFMTLLVCFRIHTFVEANILTHVDFSHDDSSGGPLLWYWWQIPHRSGRDIKPSKKPWQLLAGVFFLVLLVRVCCLIPTIRRTSVQQNFWHLFLNTKEVRKIRTESTQQNFSHQQFLWNTCPNWSASQCILNDGSTLVKIPSNRSDQESAKKFSSNSSGTQWVFTWLVWVTTKVRTPWPWSSVLGVTGPHIQVQHAH